MTREPTMELYPGTIKRNKQNVNDQSIMYEKFAMEFNNILTALRNNVKIITYHSPIWKILGSLDISDNCGSRLQMFVM